jgi:hypothetical protein
MDNSATQQGVQSSNDAADELNQEVTTAAETSTETERELSPRERAMAEIAATRRQAFEQESGLKLDDDKEDAPAPEQEAEQEVDQLAAQMDTPKVLSDGLDKVKVRTKVDGEEGEVSIDEMLREYQKGKTADRRLADLSRRQRELDEREAQLRAQVAPVATTNTPSAPVEVDPAFNNQFASALVAGDGEAANKAFADAVSRAVQSEIARGRGNAIPDAQTIAQQVKQQLVVESALEQSQKDYPQLFADPDIEALGAAKIQRKMQDESLSFTEALQSVSTEFANKFGWQPAGRQPATLSTTARDVKLERKAGIDNLPAINVKSTTTEAPPKTNSDIIAEMRARRPGYVD